jgi:transcriptional regulator with XRE-family HTH domain
MTSGHEIMGRRKALDMTQSHLAQAACVSRSTVQRAERGLSVSAESIRSIRAVLGLVPGNPVPATVQPVMQPPSPPVTAAVTPEDASALAGRLGRVDVLLMIPSLLLAAAIAWCPFDLTDPVQSLLPGQDIGRIRFGLVIGLTGLTLVPALLAGRMAWRRLFHPACDRVVIGLGRPHLMSLTDVAIELGRVPWPSVRWSNRGATARTWPGALLACLLMVPMTFAMHLDPPIEHFPAKLGYDTVTDLVPTWYVEPGSPLDRAGLRIGDVVTAMEGVPVREANEIRFRILDAYGRTPSIPVEVSRESPPGTDPMLSKVELVTLHVPVVDNPHKARCAGLPTCGWIGDVKGLSSSLWRERYLSESLATYAAEIANIARMIVDPVRQEQAIYRNRFGTFLGWTRWMSFEAAGRPAAWALALIGFGFIGGQDVLRAGRTYADRRTRRKPFWKALIPGGLRMMQAAGSGFRLRGIASA